MPSRTSSIAPSAQQLISKASRYKLKIIRSGIHGFGVRTQEAIPAGRRVIEYAGEKIGRREARRRFLSGSPGKPRRLNCLAKLDNYWVIDGAVGGNGAQLINHSCDPNLVLGKLGRRLWLVSLRRIRAGEELRYDYGFAKNGERVRCRCGSAKCRGTINKL
jgi:uncharacterized protein